MYKGKNSIIILPALLFIIFIYGELYAQDAGSRAAFTRGGWVGAKYIGMGKAAEVVADDVYAIYWNPAGLTALKKHERLSPSEVQEKIKKGEIDEISEEDLVSFSEKGKERNFVQLGITAALLDIDREAGFAGAAFNIFNGVMGVGVYSIQSLDIEARNESGELVDHIDYRGSVGYISYGFISGVAAIGVSLKGIVENIGENSYYGSGIDIGANIDLFPLVTIGFVIQDIGTSLYKNDESGEIYDKFDFGYPSLKLGIAFNNRNGNFTFALSGVKKIEQEEYEINAGIQYGVTKVLTLCLGLNDANFSWGVVIDIAQIEIAYAFALDKINFGYNNIISVSFVL